MLIVAGATALSEFRIEKLLASLQQIEASVHALSVHYCYFVDLDGALTAQERGRLDRLLGEPGDPVRRPPGDSQVLVVPRPGTTSPWSSKATDIARACGLSMIRRIERGRVWQIGAAHSLSQKQLLSLAEVLHDRMTEAVMLRADQAEALFAHPVPRRLERIVLGQDPIAALSAANDSRSLALSVEEIGYLAGIYQQLGRDPTDVEVMMFSQANSEHCRHKIFNARWIINGEEQPKSLFAMIRNTHACSPAGVLSAYRDNAAVFEGPVARRFFPGAGVASYAWHQEPADVLIKVETHNHPTAVSPFPGAATGSGGEIRDEGATGCGARPKAGLVGFCVSNLRIPGAERPWELDGGKSPRLASALDIMLEGPIGAAAFNNEFGRPCINGYFRTFEMQLAGDPPGMLRGYHKPIMIAGGLGTIRRQHVDKPEVPVGAVIVVLGGPAMLIGLGGGAASSLGSGASSAELDFASVQRGNPEMQRRAQEVIDRCWAMGDDNPIVLIHDVGAGGLSNAVPEVIAHSARGGRIELRDIPSDEPGLSPLELWCNEAQERYVIALRPGRVDEFARLCQRERCPHAVIGEITAADWLQVEDRHFGECAVQMPVSALLGKMPGLLRNVKRAAPRGDDFDAEALEVGAALERVLGLPTVADKGFLVTIGDRTVGGLISRDPLVGPWQVPVSDVAVTLADYRGHAGEAMAMGERSPLALLDGPASGRMAVAEAITNLIAADVRSLSDIRLSANWMAACGVEGEDARLFDTVHAIGEELCPALGIAIPVGKDSLSMRSSWGEGAAARSVVSPVSLVVSAFAAVADVRRTLTPELQSGVASSLLLVDLGAGRDRLGGSCLAQVHGHIGREVPDLDDPQRLLQLHRALRQSADRGLVLACHDRSDGGLVITLLEMAFAGRAGLRLDLGDAARPLAALFSEELGMVLQVADSALQEVQEIFAAQGLAAMTRCIGQVEAGRRIRIRAGSQLLLDDDRVRLRSLWSDTSWRMQRLRDHPDCADEEHATRLDESDTGLCWQLGFDPDQDIAAPFITTGVRPRVAILREQGVNSQVEMAAAFDLAGFEAVDLHMSDLAGDRARLQGFQGLVACGGFSYGDVLGAGEGWAKSILFNAPLREQFAHWFADPETFTLGVCNGCQMLSALAELIPGASDWPRFLRNRSEQFEARLSQVEIGVSPSLFLAGMSGARLPIAVSHGEGRAQFRSAAAAQNAKSLVTLRYVDSCGAIAERYPANPNGSPEGIAGVTSSDGRVTLLMPHPERVFRTVQNSWHPPGAGEFSGWMRMFRNARVFVG